MTPSTVRRAGGRRDNGDAAESLCQMLLLSGYECTVALDGSAGIEAARQSPPRVALVDIGLPLVDGFGVARELRRLFGAGIALIAMSGYSGADIQARATHAGFDDFLVKPIDLPLFLRRLESIAADPQTTRRQHHDPRRERGCRASLHFRNVPGATCGSACD